MESTFDPEPQDVLIVGSCNYKQRLRILFDSDRDHPMTLPYVDTRCISWNEHHHVYLRFTIPEDRLRKSHHFTRMRSKAGIFVYVFSESLAPFWNSEFKEIHEWMQDSTKKGVFMVLVELVNQETNRRQLALEREVELYSGLKSGEFLYFQIENEQDRTHLWAQIGKQAFLQVYSNKRK